EPAAAAVRDVNRDGTDDLVVSTYGDGAVTLLLGGPSGLSAVRTLATAEPDSGADDERLWMTADEALWPAGFARDPGPAEKPAAEEPGAELDYQPVYPGTVALVPLWMGGASARPEDDEAALVPSGIGSAADGKPGALRPGGGGEAGEEEAAPATAEADEQTPVNRFLLGAEETPAPEVSADGTSEPPAAEETPPAPAQPDPVARAEEVPPADEEPSRSLGAAVLLAAWVPWRRRQGAGRTPAAAATVSGRAKAEESSSAF
ncbi:MAG: hypothetical protein ACRC33_20830, partial [Gemmataceae bacterium]